MSGRSTTARNVLVTGASAGLGQAIARALLADGHRVWGTSRDPARLTPGEQFHPVAMELSDYASIERAAQQVLREAGHLDVLVNNAGSGVLGPLEGFDPESLEAQFRLLLHGPMALTRLVLPGMRERGSGTVINVTSLSAAFPVPFLGGYSAAKAALAAATEALRLELSGSGVAVVEIRPGDVRSEFHARMPRPDPVLPEAYARNASAALAAIEANNRRGPPASVVAQAVRRVVAMGGRPPPRLIVGGFFQAVMAPLGIRTLPYRLLQHIQARYFGLRP